MRLGASRSPPPQPVPHLGGCTEAGGDEPPWRPLSLAAGRIDDGSPEGPSLFPACCHRHRCCGQGRCLLRIARAGSESCHIYELFSWTVVGAASRTPPPPPSVDARSNTPSRKSLLEVQPPFSASLALMAPHGPHLAGPACADGQLLSHQLFPCKSEAPASRPVPGRPGGTTEHTALPGRGRKPPASLPSTPGAGGHQDCKANRECAVAPWGSLLFGDLRVCNLPRGRWQVARCPPPKHQVLIPGT